MSEIKRDPIHGTDAGGGATVTFDEGHTLADIARWICRNRSEAAEVAQLIADNLNGVDGMVIQ